MIFLVVTQIISGTWQTRTVYISGDNTCPLNDLADFQFKVVHRKLDLKKKSNIVSVNITRVNMT